MKLRILIDDGMQISLGTGIGKYSRSLYDALKLRDDVEVDLIDWSSSSQKRKAGRVEYLRYINSKDFCDFVRDYDVVLFTNYVIPFRTMPCKVVCCIPDMVSFLHPNTLPLAYRYYNRIMIRNSMQRADLVLTISKSVRNEICEYFPRYANKVKYTWLGLYEGIHRDARPGPYQDETLAILEPNEYFLFVSTVEKRKNVGLVLDAFLKLKAEGGAPGYRMVFAGRLGYGSDEFIDTANSSEYADDIIFTGYVSDSDLNRLYNEASAFVFPTLYEGFGFAQIECMSVGLPIILSDLPVNREISRDYGLFFDLYNEDTLVKAMGEVADGKVNQYELDELANRYLPDFCWDKIADQYVQMFVRALNRDITP